MPKTLYLIGGPMGVGKTAVCQRLKARLEGSVFLDGDWCWDMHPFRVTEETRALVLDNITCLLDRFLRCTAFDHVIFCWVMHRQEIVDDILSRLDTRNVRVVHLSLTCSPEALAKRLGQDVRKGLREAEVIPHSLAYLPLYEAVGGLHLDTTELTIDEAAGEILRMARQEEEEHI